MLEDAQLNMRRNYINGGPGAVVSGVVWVIAAVVTKFAGFQQGTLALFFGGMLIYPVSDLISKQMKPETEIPDKQLTRLALFTLPILFGGLFLGYVMSYRSQAYFFPIVSIAIGLRYIIFKRIYGSMEFLALAHVPFVVGITEIMFGLLLMIRRGY